MNFRVNVRDVLSSLMFVIVLGLGFVVYKQYIKIDEVKTISQSTYDGLNYISSGMSLDEQRLRKVLQTEKIVLHYNPSLKSEFAHSLAISIVDVSSRYPNFDHLLLCALIATESRFNPNAVSRVGAKGLTQIMDGTAEIIARIFTWNYYDGIALNPEKNVMMGAWYLDRMISENRGNVEFGLAYYNGGYKYGSIYKLNRRENAGLFVPEETRQYPAKVLGTYEFMKKTFKFDMQNNG